MSGLTHGSVPATLPETNITNSKFAPEYEIVGRLIFCVGKAYFQGGVCYVFCLKNLPHIDRCFLGKS